MDDFGDFNSSDPFERYNAHQAAKGRSPLPDPDELRKRDKEQKMVTVPKFLDTIGTNMSEMAEAQEMHERGEIDEPRNN